MFDTCVKQLPVCGKLELTGCVKQLPVCGKLELTVKLVGK